MAGFMIYFWAFSLIAGWYKPQFKREYQAILMMRMYGITLLRVMMIVWCYRNHTGVGVRNSLYLIAEILMILKLIQSECVKIS